MKPKIFGKNFPTKKILKPCRKFYEKFISLVKVGQKKLGIKVRILGRCHEICRKTSQGQLGEISNQSQQFSQISRNLQKTKKVQVGKRNGQFSAFFSKKTMKPKIFGNFLTAKDFLVPFLASYKRPPMHVLQARRVGKTCIGVFAKFGNQKTFCQKTKFAETFRFQSTIRNFLPSIHTPNRVLYIHRIYDLTV